MGARTNRVKHNDKTREKIRASQIVNRLMNHFDGKLELSQTQIKVGEILLKKSLPDLAAIEHTGPDGGPLQIVEVTKFSK